MMQKGRESIPHMATDDPLEDLSLDTMDRYRDDSTICPELPEVDERATSSICLADYSKQHTNR